MGRKVLIWFGRAVWMMCCLVWLWIGIEAGWEWYHLLWIVPVAGTVTMFVTVMLYQWAEEANGAPNSTDLGIPAPSKQVQRMLKRGIRRSLR